MGGLAGVDRVEVVLFDPASNDMINTHEWVGPAIEPAAPAGRGARCPPRDIPLIRALRRHEEVNLPSVGALGDALGGRAGPGSEGRGVHSALAVPLSDQGRLIGFLGFEAVEPRVGPSTPATPTPSAARRASSVRPSPARRWRRSSPTSPATTRSPTSPTGGPSSSRRRVLARLDRVARTATGVWPCCPVRPRPVQGHQRLARARRR